MTSSRSAAAVKVKGSMPFYWRHELVGARGETPDGQREARLAELRAVHRRQVRTKPPEILVDSAARVPAGNGDETVSVRATPWLKLRRSAGRHRD